MDNCCEIIFVTIILVIKNTKDKKKNNKDFKPILILLREVEIFYDTTIFLHYHRIVSINLTRKKKYKFERRVKHQKIKM